MGRDGQAWPLGKQAIGSTKNPVHKSQHLAKLMTVFRADPSMVQMFSKAYGGEPNPKDYGRALAVFQRHFMVSDAGPFDRYTNGDNGAMSASAQRGMAIFKGKGNCIASHNGPKLTDYGCYNVGLEENPILQDPDHMKVLRFDAKRKGMKAFLLKCTYTCRT
jgi:cytochrome c peroxidase